MATSPKRVYWDACSWIALIHKEKIADSHGIIVEDRETMCKSVIHAAKSGKIEIVTSALSLVEVCKDPKVKREGEDKIAAYFENDYVLLANLDRFSGEKARDLMLSKLTGLKPPDAAHIATAAVSNAEEMHTFDRKLLDLDGKIIKPDGTKLKICKPGESGAPVPLLENLPRADEGDANEAEPSEAEETVKSDPPETAEGSAASKGEAGGDGAVGADAIRSGIEAPAERPSAPANAEAEERELEPPNVGAHAPTQDQQSNEPDP